MFNFALYSFLVTSLFLIIFCVFDLKYREIPNYLVFLFFGIGLLSSIIISFWFWEFSYIINSIISVAITFVITFILWELGLFAGGDLKVFVGIAALNPLNLNFLGSVFTFGVIKEPIFGITLIIASILCTLPYILLFSTYTIITKRYFKYLFVTYFSKNNFIAIFNSIIILFLITSFMNIFSLKTPVILILLLSLVLIFLFSNILTYSKNVFYLSISSLYFIFILCVLLFAHPLNTIFIFSDLLSIIIAILIIYLLIMLYKFTKEKILVQDIKVTDLKEGVVTYYNYYLIDKKVIQKKSTFFSAIKDILSGNYYKSQIIDSRKAGGLNKKEVTFLNDSYYNKLISNNIKIKVTLAFTPSVLIAYILLNIFGDVIWVIF